MVTHNNFVVACNQGNIFVVQEYINQGEYSREDLAVI